MARRSQFAKPILLYALPLIGAGLALGTIDLIVPRDQADGMLLRIKDAPVTYGADVMAAFYHMAIAGALASAVSVISLWWCLTWISDYGYQELTVRERPFFWGGLSFAIAFPLALLIGHLLLPPVCNRLAIDDCATSALFRYTIQRVHSAKFTFVWDSDLLASLVFTTYLVSTLTVVVAGSKSLTFEQRTSALNSVLFLTTAVLLSALLAAKLRFDVGLSTLGAAPTKEAANLPFAAYQAVASAIMAYWAFVLSLCLALIYLPGAYLLTSASGKKSTFVLGPIFIPNRENFMRLLKLAAILSPPVINKLIDVISSAPKGV